MYSPVSSINAKSMPAYIYAWQEYLYNHNFKIVGTPDSVWGNHTTQGTVAFQKSVHIGTDGKVGPQTLKAAQERGFIVPIIKNLEIPGQSNVVIDISHHQKFNDKTHVDTIDFNSAYHDGVKAVIHKCTGGSSFIDKAYAGRIQKAKDASLLWGAYHFSEIGDGQTQAEFFLQKSKWDDNTLLALDWEDYKGSDKKMHMMSGDNAVKFVETIKRETGKYPVLYSRASLINHHASSENLEVLKNCPLWISYYKWKPQNPTLPNGWNEYAFWQFSDGFYGHGAVHIHGVGQTDRDIFNGTEDALNVFWRTGAFHSGQSA